MDCPAACALQYLLQRLQAQESEGVSELCTGEICGDEVSVYIMPAAYQQHPVQRLSSSSWELPQLEPLKLHLDTLTSQPPRRG